MSDYFLGEIRWFSIDWTPKGWLPCDGRILSVNQNQALYALLGTRYGGDGVNTFNLPDLRGRTGAHVDTGTPGYLLAASGGVEQVSLTTGQIPAHTHGFAATTATGSIPTPAGNLLATAVMAADPAIPMLYGMPDNAVARVPLNGGVISMAGSATPHQNMQPYLVLNPCIATTGIFPSSN